MNAADYALQLTKGIKKSFDNAALNKIKSYMENRIVNFYVTDEESEIFTSTEGMQAAEELSAEQTPPSVALGDGFSITKTEGRFGLGIVLPEHVWSRAKGDSSTKVKDFLQKQRNALLKSNVNKLLVETFDMLNNAHNGSADELAPDGVELLGAHTYASGETFDNSATALLDADAVDDLNEYAGALTDPTDITMPYVHNFDTYIVKTGSDNERMAIRLFAKDITPISVADINIYQGTKTVITTPYISDTNKLYWFSRCSQIENSVVLGIGQMPSLRSPIRLENEALRTNCTGFWKRGIINMPHDWYGSTGTT